MPRFIVTALESNVVTLEVEAANEDAVYNHDYEIIQELNSEFESSRIDAIEYVEDERDYDGEAEADEYRRISGDVAEPEVKEIGGD